MQINNSSCSTKVPFLFFCSINKFGLEFFVIRLEWRVGLWGGPCYLENSKTFGDLLTFHKTENFFLFLFFFYFKIYTIENSKSFRVF